MFAKQLLTQFYLLNTCQIAPKYRHIIDLKGGSRGAVVAELAADPWWVDDSHQDVAVRRRPPLSNCFRFTRLRVPGSADRDITGVPRMEKR